jgi:hypothetical protein
MNHRVFPSLALAAAVAWVGSDAAKKTGDAIKDAVR